MEYTAQYLENVVARLGEVFIVLDSDREYQIHGTEGYEVHDGVVRAEGLQDGEYLVVEFPLDAIEHHYTHKEI